MYARLPRAARRARGTPKPWTLNSMMRFLFRYRGTSLNLYKLPFSTLWGRDINISVLITLRP